MVEHKVFAPNKAAQRAYDRRRSLNNGMMSIVGKMAGKGYSNADVNYFAKLWKNASRFGGDPNSNPLIISIQNSVAEGEYHPLAMAPGTGLRFNSAKSEYAEGVTNIAAGMIGAIGGAVLVVVAGPAIVSKDVVKELVTEGFDYAVEAATGFAIPLSMSDFGEMAARKSIFKFGKNLDFGGSGGKRLIGFGSDDAIIDNTNSLIPKKGWYDVVIHGTEDGLAFSMNGKRLEPSGLYSMMLQNGYIQGTRIRLMSCFSGSLTNGAAYQVSKLTNAMVVAPSSSMWIATGNGFLPKGMLMVDDGGWFKVFK